MAKANHSSYEMRSESCEKAQRAIHARIVLPYNERNPYSIRARSDAMGILKHYGSILSIQVETEYEENIIVDSNANVDRRCCWTSSSCMIFIENQEDREEFNGELEILEWIQHLLY